MKTPIGNKDDQDPEEFGLRVAVRTFTPEDAKHELENKAPNVRPINNANKELIKFEMASGRWRLNGETVQYDRRGRLINGQHRMTACVESGKPFTALVVYGVESADGIDEGRRRQAGDIILGGGRSSPATAATVKFLAKLMEGKDPWGGNAVSPMSNAAVTEKYKEFGHDEISECVLLGARCASKRSEQPGTHGGPSVIAALAYLSGGMRGQFERFLMSSLSGVALPEGSASLAFMKWNLNAKSNRARPREVFVAVAVSFIAHMNDESMSVVKIAKAITYVSPVEVKDRFVAMVKENS